MGVPGKQTSLSFRPRQDKRHVAHLTSPIWLHNPLRSMSRRLRPWASPRPTAGRSPQATRSCYPQVKNPAHKKKTCAARLPGSTDADERGRLPHLERDGQVLDDGHVRAAGVVEHDILEFNVAVGRVGRVVDCDEELGGCAACVCDGCAAGIASAPVGARGTGPNASAPCSSGPSS